MSLGLLDEGLGFRGGCLALAWGLLGRSFLGFMVLAMQQEIVFQGLAISLNPLPLYELHASLTRTHPRRN